MTRSFMVHARHADRHHARHVQEISFEAAAIAYLESADLPAPAEGGHTLSVIVHDTATGHQHCFKVDLETGQTGPCG
jgi:hypothetical protein